MLEILIPKYLPFYSTLSGPFIRGIAGTDWWPGILDCINTELTTLIPLYTCGTCRPCGSSIQQGGTGHIKDKPPTLNRGSSIQQTLRSFGFNSLYYEVLRLNTTNI